MSRLKLFVPLIIFVLLAAMFWAVERRVASGDYSPTALPSALTGRELPDFAMPILESDKILARSDLLGEPFLLNVWATWCPTCHYEHPFLLDLAEAGDIALYGVNYKDDTAAARQWLAQRGNPYAATLADVEGTLGLDLGVTGAPETYLVDHLGVVRLRYQGALDDEVWQREFVPLLESIRQERQL